MRRLARLLFSFIAIVSFLLLLSVGSLWARSYWRADIVGLRGGIDASAEHPMIPFVAASNCGVLELYWNTPDWHAWRSGTLRWYVADAHISTVAADTSWLERLGFSYRDTSTIGLLGIGGLRFTFPHAVLALAFAILPALWIYRARLRGKRVRTTLCSICGYDLRASPERCPECGTLATDLRG